jgi:rhodanese-related sulfurtransferase
MRELTAPAARAALTGAAPPLLLDVREPWEVALAAIRVAGGATHAIPIGQIPQRFAELDPSQPILCVCHHGVRSAQVVAFLEHKGFDVVYNLAGGIDAWSAHVDPAVPRY